MSALDVGYPAALQRCKPLGPTHVIDRADLKGQTGMAGQLFVEGSETPSRGCAHSHAGGRPTGNSALRRPQRWARSLTA